MTSEMWLNLPVVRSRSSSVVSLESSSSSHPQMLLMNLLFSLTCVRAEIKYTEDVHNLLQLFRTIEVNKVDDTDDIQGG